MNIFSDFIAIQKALPPLVKDTQGHGYKYPTLNQLLDIVLPICHSRGLGLIQLTHPVAGGGVGVETVIFNEQNERISSGVLAMPLTTDGDGNIINVGTITKTGAVSGQYGAQAYGSALSYARRYSLTAFFCMKAEDDDGWRSSQKKEQPKEQPKKTEAELKQEAEITDVYNAMNAVLTVEELRDMTIDMTDGKDSEKRKVYWNVACKVVREKGWNVDKFSQMCIEARKGKK